MVLINLKEPLDDLITGLVEIQGVVQSKDRILCDYFINFPPEISETFGKINHVFISFVKIA